MLIKEQTPESKVITASAIKKLAKQLRCRPVAILAPVLAHKQTKNLKREQTTPYFVTNEFSESKNKNMLQQLREKHYVTPLNQPVSEGIQENKPNKPNFWKHSKKNEIESDEEEPAQELTSEEVIFQYDLVAESTVTRGSGRYD